MAKNVEIKSEPNLVEAAKRKREDTHIINEDLNIPSELRLVAQGKKFFIRTYGCQANVLDSQNIEGILLEIGYSPVDNPLQADIVILNTCAIRENAEEKVFGEIGSLKRLKTENKDSLICICGCMVQQPHIVNTIKTKYPQVDIIFGTHNIHHLPSLLNEAYNKKNRIIEVYSKEGEVIENIPCHRRDRIKAFVNIMYGCDKFCTYCIVPYTRGKQRSREMDAILKECEELVRQGYQEITLVGQNVNAYGKDLKNAPTFATLLSKVAETGINRLRFTTSHPWDFTEEMFEAIAKYPNIMPFLHLPLQSGSNDVLRRMGRRYTAEEYCHLVDRLREIVPSISLSTDIIVGFPNETEEDFQKTLDVVKYCHYDSAFTFIYSPRVGTPGAKMEDKVSMETKHERFSRLITTLEPDFEAKAQAYVGKIVPVLVEGSSKKDETILSGYTDTNKLVNFKGNVKNIGKIVNVKILESHTYSLIGEEVDE
ncbi:MAG: tRNA (N6-isopentenyl adenosine(37)-C2)-methylthiotransferase MiaB [Bacillales bacterium]|nr:tRNA (N6-isopentenyl adenosine(37)-C2)-methylthiotransferase MiaB [Bacillales bacterium]